MATPPRFKAHSNASDDTTWLNLLRISHEEYEGRPYFGTSGAGAYVAVDLKSGRLDGVEGTQGKVLWLKPSGLSRLRKFVAQCDTKKDATLGWIGVIRRTAVEDRERATKLKASYVKEILTEYAPLSLLWNANELLKVYGLALRSRTINEAGEKAGVGRVWLQVERLETP